MVEVAYNLHSRAVTEEQRNLVKDMAQMLFGNKTIKNVLAQLVSSATQ